MGIVINGGKDFGAKEVSVFISDPYRDIEKLSGKTYVNIQVISGEKKGEAAEIEEFKIYHAILELLHKEM